MINNSYKILLTIISIFFIKSICIAQEYKEWMNNPNIKVSETIKNAEEYLKFHPNKVERKLFERWKYFALRNQDSFGYLESMEDRSNSLKKHLQNNAAEKRSNLSGYWEELGPFSVEKAPGLAPGNGRITSFAYDDNDHNIIIIGSETGGVWKSIDRGENWIPLLDDFVTMDVYSVAIDPNDSNTFYFGSNRGLVYRSLNAGTTWELFYDFQDHNLVNKIVVHPLDPSILFVSIEREGLFVSSNGGGAWSRISSAGFDFEFKPGDPTTVYASGRKVYRSKDSGTTWETINTGLSNIGEKMIAVSPAAPENHYVLSVVSDEFRGLGISTNLGDSFTIRNPSTNFNFSHSPRDMAIAVSPLDANEIHIAGVDTYRSLNGGYDFAKSSRNYQNLNFPYCHADIDDLMFFDSTLVAVTDGGIYFAENSGRILNSQFYENKSHGLGIQQLYKLGITQTNPVIIAVGAQDNGSSRYENGEWRTWGGGDGMECLIKQNNTNAMFGSFQHGGLIITFDEGLTFSYVATPFGAKTNWLTPIEQDFTDASTLYVGFDKVYKSKSFGINLTPISQDFGLILHNLKVSPSDKNTMFASGFFELFKSNTEGTDWEKIYLPYSSVYISDIAIHPTDKNKVAFALSGVGVVVTEDGGKTFKEVNDGLPALYPLCLAWHDNGVNGLYVGTYSTGVYYRDEITSSWVYFSDKLPNVKISEMEINSADNKLYAATYGRGVWRTDLYSDSTNPVELGGFNAEINNRKVLLSWHTFAERDLDYFTVKKSVDGITWTDITTVEAKGSSLVRTEYEVWDENPIYGINYYMLESTSLTGDVFYSAVVDVNLSGVDLLSIYPNPNDGNFSLYVNAIQDNLVEVFVYNVEGKLVYTDSEYTREGVNEISIFLNKNPGVYFVSMKVEGQVIYEGKKIMINN